MASKGFMGLLKDSEQSFLTHSQQADDENFADLVGSDQFSLYESLCAEELHGLADKLSQRGAEAWTEIQDAFFWDGDLKSYLDEVLATERKESEALSNSKLQLIRAAEVFNDAFGGIESAEITLLDRIKIGLVLAEITFDVNHILSTMLTLVSATNKDLQFVAACEALPPIED